MAIGASVAGCEISLRALGDNVVAIDLDTDYTRSKPSILVPHRPKETVAAEKAPDGNWQLRTQSLRLEAAAEHESIRIYRGDSGDEPIAEIRRAAPSGATVVIDRGYSLHGVGANNALRFDTQEDIEELTDIDIDRRGYSYLIHHRVTGQGNNFMPWVLSAQGFGIFFDTTFPMTLDLVDGFRADGKNIRTIYFIEGPTPAEAVGHFVRLTGLPPMHPAWALGFEQSTRSWMGAGEIDFVTTYFREKKIPVDGLDILTTYGGEGGVGKSGRGFHAGYLDFYQGWHPLGSYKSYNQKLFPNGAKDIGTLRERGFRPIVHGYWMGDYADPDEMESIWQDYRQLMADGWEGWWLDGVEFCDVGESTSPDTSYAPKNLEKFTPEFREEYDNVWALMRARAFYEKQRRDFPDKRVYILNRTVFPGVQANAVGVNQGDYWSSWRLMHIQTIWLLNMGISGVMFPETDIGGHWPTEELTDELFIRWAFMATFTPLMRSHGHNWRSRLPWGFGPENEARFVPLIRLRYAMFPYNYTLLSEANQRGVPMMRAMLLEFPEDQQARKLSDQFMWGPSVLVAPIYQKGTTRRTVYLPEGEWVHFWTMQAFSGPCAIEIDAPLGRDPLFLKAGSIIPFCEPATTVPTEGDERLRILALPSGQAGSFTLYDDDRKSYAYERGESSKQPFSLSAKSGSGAFRLDIGAVEGEHEGVKVKREYRIEVPNTLASISRVVVSGAEVPEASGPDATPTKPSWYAESDRIVVEIGATEGPIAIAFA